MNKSSKKQNIQFLVKKLRYTTQSEVKKNWRWASMHPLLVEIEDTAVLNWLKEFG